MSGYEQYVAYHTAADQIRERVEQRRRTRTPGRHGRPGRKALARRLHSIADRLEG